MDAVERQLQANESSALETDTSIYIKRIITDFQGIKIPPNLLFDLLLQMDFRQQAKLVKKVIELHRIAAFLVHGEPYCGQQLLVNRLFRLKAEWKNISPIKIDVSHNGAGRSISHLWRQLASWFHLPKDVEPKDINYKICERLFTQDVILIFYTVDYMTPKVLGAWLQEFWEPLVAQVEASCPTTQHNTHLLMFLVDNSGSVCESNILLAKQFEEPDYPRIPLHLPPVSSFGLDVLDDWIDMVTAMESMQIPTGLTAKILLEKTENGVPEFVYEEICCHCGHSWEGGLAKWLI
ncbi:DNA-binding protein [Nostoc minutum NIES-26]|uniref:DNA-binding protein n=1 Tax=Nostoc minutum NIES-26 TaxID=1844469 RepID=A0A367RY54_9NOSO|nr:DNA-binding protein [Nostoc minutum NIES-26]